MIGSSRDRFKDFLDGLNTKAREKFPEIFGL